jgi:membrane-bound inhibitor of C-type lysozyme
MQAGLFSEYRADVISVDPIRRQLQRRYVDTLAEQMSPSSNESGELDQLGPLAGLMGGLIVPPTGDLRGAASMNLAQLRETLRGAQASAGNVNTQLHILDLISQIDGIIGDAPVELPALATPQGEAPTQPTEVTYQCAEGITIDAVFNHEDDTVTVTLPDGTVTLPHVVSGSGAKYSDEINTFWTKGGEAFVQVDGETTISDCHAGQEPAADEEQREAEAGPPPPMVEASYQCADGVAVDAVYDNENRTVTVTLPDGLLELPQVESASGARYSDGTTTFWSQGDEAFVEVNDEIVIQDCVVEE